SQHATLEINDPEFQLMVVDAVAKHGALLNDYREKFSAYRKNTARLQQLIEESDKAKADLDYFQFQYDELEKASLVPGEQEQLEQEFYALSNAEDIKRNLSAAHYLMHEGETSATIQLKEAGHQLLSLEKFNPQIAELHQRLNSAVIELKDIAAEIESIEQRTHTDEARAEEVSLRVSIIYNLQKKHRVNSIEELLEIQTGLSEKIQQAVFGDEAIEALRRQLEADKKDLEAMASTLSGDRKKIILGTEQQVLKSLAEMGMENAMLKIECETGDTLTINGFDSIRFLFTANKGHALAEMSKVASGGELSRLMLAIKSLIAQNTALPTIIFDEIDAGVS